MCARYLLSLDSNATNSFAFNPRFFIRTNMNNSNNYLDCFGSALWSILFMSIIAKYLLLSFYRYLIFKLSNFFYQHNIRMDVQNKSSYVRSLRASKYYIYENIMAFLRLYKNKSQEPLCMEYHIFNLKQISLTQLVW